MDSSGVWTIDVTGGEIGGRADDFLFIYQRKAGNFSLRLDEVQLRLSGNQGDARIGLMVRGSTSAGARNLFFYMDPGRTLGATNRPADGDLTSAMALPDSALDCPMDRGVLSLAIQRQGNILSLYYCREPRAPGTEETWCIATPAGLSLSDFSGEVLVGLGVAPSGGLTVHGTSDGLDVKNRPVFTIPEGSTSNFGETGCPPWCPWGGKVLGIVWIRWRDLLDAIGFDLLRIDVSLIRSTLIIHQLNDRPVRLSDLEYRRVPSSTRPGNTWLGVRAVFKDGSKGPIVVFRG